MDYVMALGFILGSTFFIVRNRPVIAGLMLGFAIGSRITSGAMVLPLALYIFLIYETNKIRSNMKFILSTTIMAIMCFLPVITKYGLKFFRFSDHPYPTFYIVMSRATTGVWGSIGVVAILLVCFYTLLFWKTMKSSLCDRKKRNIVIFSFVVILLYSIAYLRLPDESGYLIPVVPFVLIIISLVTPLKLLRLFCVLMIASPFFTIGMNGISADGPIIQDHQLRQSMLSRVSAFIRNVDTIQGKAVIIAGPYLPQIQSIIGSNVQGSHRYIYLFERQKDIERYKKDGFNIYFLPGQDNYNIVRLGIDPKKYGGQLLNVP